MSSLESQLYFTNCLDLFQNLVFGEGDVGGSGGRKCGGERESQGRSDSSFIKMEVVF